jgi:DNA-binding NarL/FixJ family response regulator
MDRTARLDGTLRELMSGDTLAGTLDGVDAVAFGLLSLRLTWRGEFARAADAAAGALARADDPESLTLARAAAGLCIASWVDGVHDPALRDPRTGADPLLAARDDPQHLDAHVERPLAALLAEGALACARLDLATELLGLGTTAPVALFGDPRHPFLTFTRVLEARIRAFRGDVSGALVLADSAVESASSTLELVFAGSCAALVRGNADQRAETRRLVDVVAAGTIPPIDTLSRGCFVLAAYGAVALGDIERAAELILRGGGGPDLDRLRIIDRVLGLELLVSAAVADDDLDAAQSWLHRALPLAGHPIASSTVDRIRARVALLAGDAHGAQQHAAASIERAKADGRSIEVEEGTIVLARARIALNRRGEAARDLAASADRARGRGHLAVLRSASRELRTVGRRLPPAASSGWDGLSTREREVAMLLAEGHTNAEVARALFLSENTVRIHVSRVLHAFGVPSRSGVAAALAGPAQHPAPELTPRQRQVVEHLVAGRSNRQISESLGIGVTTVEKHVAAILRQWQVGSRAAIVRLALGERAGVSRAAAPRPS